MDGNFKANHVRQKNAAEDIWLYEGSGMTARRSEYESFLKTAKESSGVSRSAIGISRISANPIRNRHAKTTFGL